MTPQSQQGQGQSIAAQASQLSPSEFKAWAQKRTNALNTIIDSVIEVVEERGLEPTAGARIASCVAGSVFGYEEFHPRAGTLPAEQMLDALNPQLAQSTRELVSH